MVLGVCWRHSHLQRVLTFTRVASLTQRVLASQPASRSLSRLNTNLTRTYCSRPARTLRTSLLLLTPNIELRLKASCLLPPPRSVLRYPDYRQYDRPGAFIAAVLRLQYGPLRGIDQPAGTATSFVSWSKRSPSKTSSKYTRIVPLQHAICEETLARASQRPKVSWRWWYRGFCPGEATSARLCSRFYATPHLVNREECDASTRSAPRRECVVIYHHLLLNMVLL